MATSSSSSSSSSSPPPAPSTGSASNASDSFTASEWTQQSMMSDLMQQKGLLIGVGAVLLGLLFFRGRSSKPEQKAARRLVRDWRHVDDPEDARDLLGENLPTILRPALLIALEEIERQVHRGFQKLEREIERL